LKKEAKQMKNKLRVIRAELGISQAELAEMAGLSRVTVNRVERGIHTPDGTTILKLARALCRPASEIFDALCVA
jgi:putative transcriptional regulator